MRASRCGTSLSADSVWHWNLTFSHQLTTATPPQIIILSEWTDQPQRSVFASREPRLVHQLGLVCSTTIFKDTEREPFDQVSSPGRTLCTPIDRRWLFTLSMIGPFNEIVLRWQKSTAAGQPLPGLSCLHTPHSIQADRDRADQLSRDFCAINNEPTRSGRTKSLSSLVTLIDILSSTSHLSNCVCECPKNLFK